MKKLTDYEKYIRTEELLELQKTEGELCCDDELTFQTIHQIAELHFKLILQHIKLANQYMRGSELTKAIAQLRRINVHLEHLPHVFDMVKAISPRDYHTIRLALGRGSGQDSPGFNAILQQGPTLWAPFETLLLQNGLSPLTLHQDAHKYFSLFTLMQELHTFDEKFQSFRYSHIQLVRRMIGLETKSLKGVPAQALERGARTMFYPQLWRAISDLTDVTGSSYNPQPLD
ncbi:tryptophan 2,3-dioxygenase family protein [Ectobacillus antri]|jgi:tryptophan 2,3-dioxygenase|uniref:Tryptophan 2,3-dioxygenase family protein n=1 Tax=Ectobacillus antri TaxID=2486280 RepID=A0ABT6H8N2_9BACI|nr:tryptophan 2,3-dioxygenase family protein [Ectobacillus antri]MDG4658036.1 tryptophan 2,3-dioxygenase family protein [Ectobacillus antri]MDG5755074.1 tryptophan 2,3-dioxygenase family protein [Ectobacillus antri]